jgi:hypothetical protein
MLSAPTLRQKDQCLYSDTSVGNVDALKEWEPAWLGFKLWRYARGCVSMPAWFPCGLIRKTSAVYAFLVNLFGPDIRTDRNHSAFEYEVLYCTGWHLGQCQLTKYLHVSGSSLTLQPYFHIFFCALYWSVFRGLFRKSTAIVMTSWLLFNVTCKVDSCCVTRPLGSWWEFHEKLRVASSCAICCKI